MLLALALFVLAVGTPLTMMIGVLAGLIGVTIGSAAIITSWWWWLPPIIIIIVLFTGLFLIAVGLDDFANPRLRRRA